VLRSRVVPLLAALALTACGGADSASSTDCSLDGCTITFPRGEDSAQVSVLGVEARLDSVSDGSANLTVAGQGVSLDVGSSTEVAGFTVGVQSVTDTEVVATVTR
jgi:hypothetical protein